MSKNPHTATERAPDTETTEEIVGVLTAISVVSKRMAKKLLLLEQQAKKEGETRHGNPLTPHANKGSTV